jgi:hypothetical protein
MLNGEPDRQRKAAIYKVAIVGGSCIGLIILLVILLGYGSRTEETQGWLVIALCCLGLSNILFLILLFKAWSLIQDVETRTTPGKAIGFLFIPLFSLYWAFVALPGFVSEFNAYVDRHHPQVRHNESGLFMLMPLYGILLQLAGILRIGWGLILFMLLYFEALC